MTARALVTGGAGFIGSHLVDALVAHGAAVTVLDDFSSGRRENLSEAQRRGSVRIVEGSVLDEAAVAEAIGGCTLVYHLAVQCVRSSLGRPLENHAVNATGTLRVLEAARRQKVARFVYCSSSEVYGNCGGERLNEETTQCAPVTVYGAAKLAGEHYALAYFRTYGLSSAVVRPFNAYGPRSHATGESAEVVPRFIVRALNGLPPVIFGTGENARDFTYVTETARAIALAGGCDRLVGRVANIAYGKKITIASAAAAVTRLCGRPELKPTHMRSRPGDVDSLQADTRVAQTMLGFSAEIEFEEGLKRTIEWFRAHHRDPSLLLEEETQNWHMPVN